MYINENCCIVKYYTCVKPKDQMRRHSHIVVVFFVLGVYVIMIVLKMMDTESCDYCGTALFYINLIFDCVFTVSLFSVLSFVGFFNIHYLDYMEYF